MKKTSAISSIVLLALFTLSIVDVKAQLTLPAIFNDGMVLQQNSEVTIWGWGKPVQNVTVTCSWGEEVKETVVNNEGDWNVTINTPTAGGPYVIRIKGNEELVVNDVLVGEVWLCSGQSNMEWSADAEIDNAKEEIKKANHPNIRLFTVGHRAADVPQLDVTGHWEECTPETMRKFSAIGYFFGRELQEKMDVPVGIINASWGGTPAEIWTPAEAITQDNFLAEAAKTFTGNKWGPFSPGRAYNTMIHPLTSFNISGVLWYQGESNVVNDYAYEKLFATMIHTWREAWGKELPFYFAQIAPYRYSDFGGAEIREAQRRTLKLPNTAMVVTSDIGDTTDIHPRDKLSVAKRFADIALTKHYQIEDKIVAGPEFENFEVNKNKLIVHFENEEGLNSPEKQISKFEIAGEDGIFHDARAKLREDSVELSSKKVKNPKAVRYGWRNKLVANLFNAAGLPASSFSSLEEYAKE